MIWKIFFSLSFCASIALAGNTSEEDAVVASVSAANRNASQAIDSAKKALSTFSDATSTFANSLWAKVESAAAGAKSSGSNLLEAARSKAGEALSYDEEGAQNFRKNSTARQTDNNAEAFRAQLRAEDARDKAAEAVQSAVSSVNDAATKTMEAARSSAAAKLAQANQFYKDQLFENLMKTNGLQSSFATINAKYSNVNDAMNMLERYVDKTNVGSYVQQKVARLLSSDNLCKAAQSCEKGHNKAKFDFKDLKDIFPENNTGSMNSRGTKYPGTESGAK